MKAKALSVKQPWAHMILFCGKPYENRTWYTSYRGPLYIHASKGVDMQAYYFFRKKLGKIIPEIQMLKRGRLIGKVDLVDVITESTSPWFDGPYGFVLENPEPIVSIPMKGQLGIFDINIEDKG